VVARLRFPLVPALALALAAVLVPAAARARPWTLADLGASRFVSAVHLAPRGDRFIYSVTWTDPQTHQERQTWYLRSADRADDAALDIPADATPDDPEWSPAGDALAWTADGRLWRYDLATRERRALTDGGRAVRTFAWSPDGSRIAATEQPKPAATAAKAPSYWLDPLASGVVPTRPEPIGLWLLDATSGAQRQIAADGSFGGEAAPAAPVWFRDGRRIAIARQPSAYYADYERERYVVVDTRSGTTTPVGGTYSLLPGASPPAVDDAGRMAYVHTVDGTTSGRTGVFLGDRELSSALDRDFWSCGGSYVTTDGRALFASALDGAAMRVFRLDGDAPQAITPADRTVQSYSVARSGRIAYVESAPDLLPEVVLADADGAHAVRVTHASSLPAGVDVAPTQLLRTRTADGHDLVAQLTQPRTSGKMPMIVELHGGPQCSDDIGFSPAAQWFATNGYAFLRPNPRGSDGYGAWSYKAIVNDWGDGPLGDVRATVDSALALGTIDPARLFVEGGSYGGYLTSWTVTHDDRFKAAVAGWPVVDLALSQALTRSPGIARRFFGSTPLATKEGRERMRAQSPATYTDALHTPLLLMAGLHDAQAPYPQTIAWYRALHESGKDVRLLIYPDAAHGPGPGAYGDTLAHVAGWFAAHGGLDIPGALKPPAP
jgi:dipeptidyl aminopeptidase/acylaminoacyl peptidase